MKNCGKCKKRVPVLDYMEVMASNWPEVAKFCTAIHEDEFAKYISLIRPGEILVRNEFGRVYMFPAEQFRLIYERIDE